MAAEVARRCAELRNEQCNRSWHELRRAARQADHWSEVERLTRAAIAEALALSAQPHKAGMQEVEQAVTAVVAAEMEVEATRALGREFALSGLPRGWPQAAQAWRRELWNGVIDSGSARAVAVSRALEDAWPGDSCQWPLSAPRRAALLTRWWQVLLTAPVVLSGQEDQGQPGIAPINPSWKSEEATRWRREVSAARAVLTGLARELGPDELEVLLYCMPGWSNARELGIEHTVSARALAQRWRKRGHAAELWYHTGLRPDLIDWPLASWEARHS